MGETSDKAEYLNRIKQLETEVEGITVDPNSSDYIAQFKKRLSLIREIDRLYFESKYWSDKRISINGTYE